MTVGVSNFDAVKFRKVAALMTGGATDGERGAARTRATVIAANADKRAAVLSMLDASPEVSDREISRRAGVSPQTVNNWRHRI